MSPASSPEPASEEEEAEIQQILEDMETAAEDPGTKEDEEDTVVVAHPGSNSTDGVGLQFTDSSLTLDKIRAAMRYVAGAWMPCIEDQRP